MPMLKTPIKSNVYLKFISFLLCRLRDEVRNIPCTYKSRNDAAADLIHIYAFTKNFFRIQVLTYIIAQVSISIPIV